jgi:hypothetical protein
MADPTPTPPKDRIVLSFNRNSPTVNKAKAAYPPVGCALRLHSWNIGGIEHPRLPETIGIQQLFYSFPGSQPAPSMLGSDLLLTAHLSGYFPARVKFSLSIFHFHSILLPSTSKNRLNKGAKSPFNLWSMPSLISQKRVRWF